MPETRRLEVAGAATATMEVTDSPTGRSVTVFSAGDWSGLGPSSLDLALSGPPPGTALSGDFTLTTNDGDLTGSATAQVEEGPSVGFLVRAALSISGGTEAFVGATGGFSVQVLRSDLNPDDLFTIAGVVFVPV
jgi:hypothetical protein